MNCKTGNLLLLKVVIFAFSYCYIYRYFLNLSYYLADQEKRISETKITIINYNYET